MKDDAILDDDDDDDEKNDIDRNGQWPLSYIFCFHFKNVFYFFLLVKWSKINPKSMKRLLFLFQSFNLFRKKIRLSPNNSLRKKKVDNNNNSSINQSIGSCIILHWLLLLLAISATTTTTKRSFSRREKKIFNHHHHHHHHHQSLSIINRFNFIALNRLDFVFFFVLFQILNYQSILVMILVTLSHDHHQIFRLIHSDDDDWF